MELRFWGGGSFLTAHRQSSLQESRGLEFKSKQVQKICQMNSREASGLRAQRDQVTVLGGGAALGRGVSQQKPPMWSIGCNPCRKHDGPPDPWTPGEPLCLLNSNLNN